MSLARRLIDLTDVDLRALVLEVVRSELASSRPSEPEVLSTKDAAVLLGIHPGTLQKMTREGRIPVHFIGGGVRRYKRSELLRWLDENRADE